MSNDNLVNDAAKLGAALAAPQTLNAAIPFVVIPETYELTDLEKLYPAPFRKRGNTVLRDASSFIDFASEHKDDQTKLYGRLSPPSFKAVFNDDSAAAPGWGDHTATYACPLSIEWSTWSASNKKQMNQETFAQFIEDNAPDCVTPDAASMIEIARTLEAKKKVNFASGIRLSNGQNELTYEEEITGTASKGKMPLPETFDIGIPVFDGGAPWKLTARLRYRIADGGKLTIWYDLERPHKTLEQAAKEVWATIAAGTSLSIFNGD
jgi:uncharacterized protein YfdQ (DUF2303 family)